MNAKVYIDNLASVTTERDLMELFSHDGNVAQVNVLMDRTNGRPRGFGFVTMAMPEGAQVTIRALHGKEIGTHHLIVSEAWLHEARAGLSDGPGVPRCHSNHLYQIAA